MMVILLAIGRASAGNTCDVGGPGDAGLITLNGHNYATIDQAVAAAGAGDTILVCQGTYATSAVIERSITLRAVDGPAVTRLDGIFDPAGIPSIVWVLKIRAPGLSAPTVDGFSIVGVETTFAGIQVTAGSELVLTNSLVFGNDRGLQLDATANLVMLDTEVFGNSSGGVLALGHNVLNLSGSAVWGNVGLDGAGLSLRDDVTVVGGDVYANQAAERGGGVFVEGTATLLWTKIEGNTSEKDGGGAYVALADGGSLTAVDTTFDGNYAWERGGGLFLEGPVKDASTRGTTSLDLDRCSIAGNRTEGSGGGIWSGALRVTTRDTPIDANVAVYGGGLFVVDTNGAGSDYDGLTVTNNQASSCAGIDVDQIQAQTRFAGAFVGKNVAAFSGGGVCVGLPTPSAVPFAGVSFLGSTIADNVAGTEGGGFRFRGDQQTVFSESTITESTIERNTAGSGGGGFEIDEHHVRVVGAVVRDNQASEGQGARLIGAG
ncbi:MAG: hypothetical protein ABMB14_36655, partial [Myxococcota bacterium]